MTSVRTLVVSIICEGCGAEHGIEEYSPKVWRWQPMTPEQLKEEIAKPRWCDDCGQRTLARVATVQWHESEALGDAS